MKSSLKTIGIAGAAFLALTGAAQAQDFMTQKEILATIPGSTIYGISNQDNKTQWAQAYSKGRKKGKLAGNSGGNKYEGKWYVDGDMWCEETGDWVGCFQFVRLSEKELQPYKDGQPRNKWTIQ